MRCEKCGRIYSFTPDNQAQVQAQQGPQIQWTPRDIDSILHTVDGLLNGLADKVINFRQNEARADTEFLATAGKHNRHILYAMLIFLGALIALMSYLTVKSVVSGDALLFLAGTITTYVIVLIQRLVRWTNPIRPKETE